LTISIKDIGRVLDAKDTGGNPVPPVLVILIDALGAGAGTGFAALAAMAMWFCGLSAVTWSSRVIWAFARDEGLPLSAIWKRVSATHGTPAPAIWLSVTTAFLAAVYSGAYAVVTSISTVGLYLSYIIPVCLLLRVRGTPREIARGPWHLGRFGAAVNTIAILWVIFLTVVLSLPDEMRAGKSILALTVVLGVWYGLAERRRFQGPAWTAR
jgi:amino acid transporter